MPPAPRSSLIVTTVLCGTGVRGMVRAVGQQLSLPNMGGTDDVVLQSSSNNDLLQGHRLVLLVAMPGCAIRVLYLLQYSLSHLPNWSKKRNSYSDQLSSPLRCGCLQFEIKRGVCILAEYTLSLSLSFCDSPSLPFHPHRPFRPLPSPLAPLTAYDVVIGPGLQLGQANTRSVIASPRSSACKLNGVVLAPRSDHGCSGVSWGKYQVILFVPCPCGK